MMDISVKNRKKLVDEGYSLEEISQDTGINISKLEEGCRLSLSGEELLVLCSYMDWDPRDFWTPKEKTET